MCGLCWTGSEYYPLTDFCDYGNERHSVNKGNCLVSWLAVSLMPRHVMASLLVWVAQDQQKYVKCLYFFRSPGHRKKTINNNSGVSFWHNFYNKTNYNIATRFGLRPYPHLAYCEECAEEVLQNVSWCADNSCTAGVPNCALILIKVKFQGCRVMKMKINAMNTPLGGSIFVFVMVILNSLLLSILF